MVLYEKSIDSLTNFLNNLPFVKVLRSKQQQHNILYMKEEDEEEDHNLKYMKHDEQRENDTGPGHVQYTQAEPQLQYWDQRVFGYFLLRWE